VRSRNNEFKGNTIGMATIAQGSPSTAEEVNYLNVEHGWKSWLFTTDHKRIAILYIISITLMFFVGGFFAVMVRVNLLSPEGNYISAETYNRFFSMHGIIMVFFFLVPSIPATLANFLVLRLCRWGGHRMDFLCTI
jgi:cytochrome c oxidase subunit 1